jgi:hypothetical protein
VGPCRQQQIQTLVKQLGAVRPAHLVDAERRPVVGLPGGHPVHHPSAHQQVQQVHPFDQPQRVVEHQGHDRGADPGMFELGGEVPPHGERVTVRLVVVVMLLTDVDRSETGFIGLERLLDTGVDRDHVRRRGEHAGPEKH